jgi:hypothetical protein
MAEKKKIIVELYELTLTDREDDRFGRVVHQGSINVDALIEIAVERRTDLNPVTLKASYEILKDIALEKVLDGCSVAFGLTYNNLKVNGTFYGNHPKWNPEENSVSLQATPLAIVRQKIDQLQVDVRGMSSTGIVINTVTDVASAEVNTRLTPGGGMNISGSKIKIVGDVAGVGIHLRNIDSQEVWDILPTSILVNDPSKISFIIPSDLREGDYHLSITTQYSNGSILLKEARTYTFDYVLACANR